VTEFFSKNKIGKKYFCTKQFWKKVFSEKNILLDFLSPKVSGKNLGKKYF
jgi:hypothetical protein